MQVVKIRVLNDYIRPGYENNGGPIPVGTVIEQAFLVGDFDTGNDRAPKGIAAVYAHPVSEVQWISYQGDYEIIE